MLEHGDELQDGCSDSCPSQGPAPDVSGRRAALLEGAMTSAIRHPNVVQTYDMRVVNLNRSVNMHGGLSIHRCGQRGQYSVVGQGWKAGADSYNNGQVGCGRYEVWGLVAFA